MYEIFVFGSVWFWALVVFEVGLLLLFTEFENGIAATASAIAFLVILQFFGDIDIISHLRSNPLHIVYAALAYLMLGVIWLTFQWMRFVKFKLAEYDKFLGDFMERNELPRDTKVVPAELKQKWKERVENTRDYDTRLTIADVPKIAKNKGKAIRWMSLWPFSMALFFLKDMVKEVWNFIYTRIAGFLQRIADNMWRDDIKSNLAD